MLIFGRVCVTARVDEKNVQPLRLWTFTYAHHESLRSPDPDCGNQDVDFLIWEAGRATSAAPLYFKYFKNGSGNTRSHADGGIIINNPSSEALEEVRNRSGLDADGERKNPAVLLSIGTGIKYGTPFAALNSGNHLSTKAIPIKESIKQRIALVRHMRIRYTDGELIHQSIREAVGGDHKWYKRLNVDTGLGEMGLGDWREGDPNGNRIMHPGGQTLSDMKDAVRRYHKLCVTNNIEWFLLPKTLIDHTAERLVRHKRERAALARRGDDVARWDTHRGRWLTDVSNETWNEDSSDLPHDARVAA